MPDINQLLNQSTELTVEGFQERARYVRSQLAKQAMTTRVEAGECPAIAPIGYQNVVVGERRTVSVDQTIAPLIAEAFHLAARRKSSLRKILAQLTPRGLVGRSGQPMGTSSLQVVLTNPFYAGLIRHNGMLYRGAHQPLISKSLFER